MKNGLLSIGRMAEMNHVTIAALRLYDEEGLLKPAYTDPSTGYRYYDIHQNARLDMIAYMKELGMSLQEIKKVLQSGDPALIESILANKNEQIHEEIRQLHLQQAAVENAIKALERTRKSPVTDTIFLEYNDRRFLWSIPCTTNFYAGDLSDFETCLLDLRMALLNNGFPNIHTYSVATTIKKENFAKQQYVPDKLLIFGDNALNKVRKDLTVLDAGMYACIYTDNYDNELSCAHRLFTFCNENKYAIAGDYICEILSEFNVFDESRRNMFLRLQVPIQFS